MGTYTVNLANAIIAARTDYNESLIIQGAHHPSTLKAQAKLTELNADAKYLFSPRHA